MSVRDSERPQSWDVLRMSYRALFLLSLWNDRTLQGPGFAWTIYAGRGGEERAARHAAGFNTTPAMAPCVIGAVARMESDGESPEAISRVRDSGASSLAAIGDQLFWGSIRPSAALAGVVTLPLGPVFSVAILLLVQGVPQFAFRVLGLVRGLSRGKTAIPEFIRIARRAFGVTRFAGAALAGLFAGAVLAGADRSYGTPGLLVALAAVPVLGWLVSFRGASPAAICITMLAVSGMLSLLLGP